MDNYEFKEAEIDVLNNDCMTQIFSFLSISERIRAERVCKRWETVLQDSWNSCNMLCLRKNFSTDDILFNLLSNDADEHKSISAIVHKVLKNCGNYIKEVKLEIPNSDNTAIVLSEIEKNCCNVESFTLKCHTEEYEYDENILSSFFSKNKNLKKLSLANLCITGFSFLNLNTETLELLALYDCCKFKKIHALKVFQELKSLKFFKLLCCEQISEMALLGIITSGCQLSEFAIGAGKAESDDLEDYNELLLEFLPKQENLKYLQLNHQHIFEDTLMSIKAEKIVILELVANQIPFEKLLYFISVLKNLKSLYITFFEGFNDRFIQALSNCEELFELKLILTQPIDISLRSKMYFSKLSNLTALIINTLRYEPSLTNNLLFGIGECKNLKIININNRYLDAKITNMGIKAITSLPLLEILIVSNLNNITDNAFFSLSENLKYFACINCQNIRNKGLEEVLRKCKNLEFFIISGCDDVKINKFIETASKIKDHSSSTHVLKITVSEYIDINEFKYVSPLIKIVQSDYDDFNLDAYIQY